MKLFDDTPKLRGLRERLVLDLHQKGIHDREVLQAMKHVLRHAFVESAFVEKAYLDIPLPIGEEQTISQPFTVAFMTQLLALHTGDRVLEVGTGSGYQASILCEMGCEVYSIERHRALLQEAKLTLRQLGYYPQLKVGDGTLGWPVHGPYRGIVVTAGGPSVPKPLLAQLAVGGRLVIPVGDRDQQQLLVVRRLDTDDSEQYETVEFADFKFVPLIGEAGW
jgi:protein-L-isoaspartate(D-aspartate) O-methyltransferase